MQISLRQVLLDMVLANANRLLTCMDREYSSPTFGCFDRSYWHYKIVDFPCARYQEAALTLGLLYATPSKLNPYYLNPKVEAWIKGAIDFWINIQHSDGSFDEWYPNEHSFCATAFSTYAISEAALLYEHECNSEVLEQPIKEALKRAGRWLIEHDEPRISNQQAGRIIALDLLDVLGLGKQFREQCDKAISQIVESQSIEGWFPEYGGADLGYLTVTIDYLAKYTKLDETPKLLISLEKALMFLSYFLGPDGAVGGEYGSRNTSLFLPHGCAVLRNRIPIADQIIRTVLSWHQTESFSALNFDDRLLCYLLYSYLLAYRELPINLRPRHMLESHKEYFDQARIFSVRDQNYHTIVSLGKGGLIKVYDVRSRRLIFSDSGCLTFFTDGERATSNYLDPRYEISVDLSTKRMQVKGSLHRLKYYPPSPGKTVLLRGFTSTLGNVPFAQKAAKEWFRKMLILGSNNVPIDFSRKIGLDPERLEISDTFSRRGPRDGNYIVKDVFLTDYFFPIYVPSSRLFHLGQLYSPATFRVSHEEIQHLNTSGRLSIKRIFDMSSRVVQVSYP